MDLKNVSTKELVNELSAREAVQSIAAEPYRSISIRIDQLEQCLEIESGPAEILVIWD